MTEEAKKLLQCQCMIHHTNGFPKSGVDMTEEPDGLHCPSCGQLCVPKPEKPAKKAK